MKLRRIEDFVKPTQKELFSALVKLYSDRAITCKNGYILVQGEAPVLLVAHLDTVHKEQVKTICHSDNGNILMSPQGIGGDDRCGVFALYSVYKNADVKPYLLFTCDEEIGGVGAEKFCEAHRKGKLPKELDSLKLLIEVDRRGENDAVYYDCENPDFERYISQKGFTTANGSFSDISLIAPELGVAAVNLSSGYYNAHTQHEYINKAHLASTISRIMEIVAESVAADFPKFEYMEMFRSVKIRGKSHKSKSYYDDWFCDTLCGYDTYESDLDQVPESVQDEFIALLDLYDPAELEFVLQQYGENFILCLFQMEFGGTYAEVTGADEEL